MNEFVADSFLTYTLGILVFFVGFHLNRRVEFLREFNIPEPVTGGLLACLAVFSIYSITGTEIVFDITNAFVIRFALAM